MTDSSVPQHQPDLLDILIQRLGEPPHLEHATPLQRVKFRIIYILQFAYIAAWLPYTLLYGAWGGYLSAAICFFVGALPSFYALHLIRSRGHFVGAGLISSVASATALSMATFTTGGVYSPVSSWYIIIIMGAYIQLGMRLGHYVTLYIVSLLADHHPFLSPAQQQPV